MYKPDILIGDRGEVCSQYVALLQLVGLVNALNHFEADVLALFVAVQPQDKEVGAF